MVLEHVSLARILSTFNLTAPASAILLHRLLWEKHVWPYQLARSANTIQETTCAQRAQQTVTPVQPTLDSVPSVSPHSRTTRLQTLALVQLHSTRLLQQLQTHARTALQTVQLVQIIQELARDAYLHFR